MRRATLSLEEIKTIDEFHDALVLALDLPAYYGRNLDALDECLADCCSNIAMTVTGLRLIQPALCEPIGRYIEVMRNFEAASGGSFRLIEQPLIRKIESE